MCLIIVCAVIVCLVGSIHPCLSLLYSMYMTNSRSCIEDEIRMESCDQTKNSFSLLFVKSIVKWLVQGSHWSWKVVKSHEIWLFIFQDLKLDMGAEKVIKKSWFLLVLSWKTKILNPQFFPVTFVLNYWNCLCVLHKLSYLLLFSYTTCC